MAAHLKRIPDRGQAFVEIGARAGLARFSTRPAEIDGKQALFVLNLASKRMCGAVSEGMLFDLGYADGITCCWLFQSGQYRTGRGRASVKLQK